jgi:hypothetical protein
MNIQQLHGVSLESFGTAARPLRAEYLVSWRQCRCASSGRPPELPKRKDGHRVKQTQDQAGYFIRIFLIRQQGQAIA